MTHSLPIPGGLKQVMAATGAPPLDQRPSFSADETYARLAAFGAHGRKLYRRFTLTTDIVFPLTWMPLLTLYARIALSKRSPPHVLRLSMLGLPFFWLAADVTENLFVFVLLSGFPTRQPGLEGGIAFPTTFKWVALILALAGPTLLLRVYRARRWLPVH